MGCNMTQSWHPTLQTWSNHSPTLRGSGVRCARLSKCGDSLYNLTGSSKNTRIRDMTRDQQGVLGRTEEGFKGYLDHKQCQLHISKGVTW